MLEGKRILPFQEKEESLAYISSLIGEGSACLKQRDARSRDFKNRILTM